MFQNPQFIYMIPVVLLLLGVLYIRSRRKRRNRIRELSQIHESPAAALNNHSVTRSRLKVTLTLLGFLLLLTALARPQFGFQWVEVRKTEKNLLFVLDVSHSMLVEDVYPNRLGRSKLIIREIVDRYPGANVGLLIFAGSAFLQCPITEDHQAFNETLSIQNPSILKDQGSDISKALLMVPDLIQNPETDRVIVISDGEDHSTRISYALKYLQDRQFVVNTICIGTEKGGLIPNNTNESSEPYFYDRMGNVVYSRANPQLMSGIANQLKGRSLHFNSENYSIRRLDELLITDRASYQTTKAKKLPVDYYQLPLIITFIFLCLEFAIGTRKRMPTTTATKKGSVA